MANGRTTRLCREIEKLRSSVKFILDKSPLDDQSGAPSNIIVGRILPDSDPFNQAAFQIEIKIPTDYPFSPPEVRIITPMYHPNISKDGKICIALLNEGGTYRPTTSLIDIVLAIIDLIDNPQADHFLDAGNGLFDIFRKRNCFSFFKEIGAEYLSNRAEFNRKALEMVKKHGLPRE